MQNIAILLGHIGKNPESRHTNNGTHVTTFSLATSRPRYHDGKPALDKDGQRVQDTEWHRVTCFNGQAKAVEQYCEKGTKVFVLGRLHYSEWTDKDNVKRYGCEVIAETVEFLGRPKSAQEGTTSRDEIDDEIPF